MAFCFLMHVKSLIMNFHWFSVKINRSNISQNVGQLTLVWINLQGVSSASVYLFFTNSMPKKIHNKKIPNISFFFCSISSCRVDNSSLAFFSEGKSVVSIFGEQLLNTYHFLVSYEGKIWNN